MLGHRALNGRLVLPGGVFEVETPNCEYFYTEEGFLLPVLEPFTATSSGWSVQQPVTLKSTTTFGAYGGTITDSEKWHLVNGYAGSGFQIFSAW